MLGCLEITKKLNSYLVFLVTTETGRLTHFAQCTPRSLAPAEPHHTPHNLTRPSFGNTSVMLMKSRPTRLGLGEVLRLKEHSPCNQK